MVTRKLNVPLVRQAKGSADCGPASITMILKYYGIKRNIDELSDSIRNVNKDINPTRYPSLKNGYTYAPQLGLYLMREGFKVDIITFNPWIFNHRDKSIGTSELRFKQMYDRIKLKRKAKEELKVGLRFFIDFVDKGGRITVKIPDKSDIENELKNGRPLISLLTTNFLYPKQSKQGFNFHFNVVTGIDNKRIYVNDPLAGKNGGKLEHQVNDYLFGMYSSAFGAPDNASLIKIRR